MSAKVGGTVLYGICPDLRSERFVNTLGLAEGWPKLLLAVREKEDAVARSPGTA